MIDSRIWLLVAKAAIFQIQYRWDAVMPVVKQAEQLLAELNVTLSSSDRMLVQGYLDWFWAFHWLVLGEAERVKEVAQQALRNLPRAHRFAFGSALTMLTVALQWLGESEAARQLSIPC